MKTKQLIERAISKSYALLYYTLGSIGSLVFGFGAWAAVNRDPASVVMVAAGGVIWFATAVALVLTEA